MFIPWNTYLELKKNNHSLLVNLPLKIQGGTSCLVTQYFFLSQYFECKQAAIERILNKVSKNYRLQIPRPGGGDREGFHIRFNVASNMWNLGFKGLLHILMNPIFFYFLHFRLT